MGKRIKEEVGEIMKGKLKYGKGEKKERKTKIGKERGRGSREK